MLSLGELTQSEFNLLGVVGEEELVRAMDTANPAAKQNFARSIKLFSKSRSQLPSARSRGELEKRLHMLPRETQEGLVRQTLQATDKNYYVTKDISGSKVQKMFRDDDTKVTGMSNISSGKLEKGYHFMLTAIALQVGFAAQGESVHQVNFARIPDFIRNGEFEFLANGATMIQASGMEVFNVEKEGEFIGQYNLDNPKLIKDQQAIELNMEWGFNAPEGTWARVYLIGTTVIKS